MNESFTQSIYIVCFSFMFVYIYVTSLEYTLLYIMHMLVYKKPLVSMFTLNHLLMYLRGCKLLHNIRLLCHIFVYRDLSRVAELKTKRRSRSKKYHIVKSDWVRECMEEGDLSSERQFEPS